MLRGFALAIVLLACAHASAAQQPASQKPAQAPAHASSAPKGPHYISVTFSYDFGKTPPCPSSKPKLPCVQQFAVYDITDGVANRQQLFIVKLPANRKGIVPAIPGAAHVSMPSGKRLIAVTAQDPSGNESSVTSCASCTTLVIVPQPPAPGSSAAPPAAAPASAAPPAHP